MMNNKNMGIAASLLVALALCGAGLFLYALSPVGAQAAAPTVFEIDAGQGFRAVADRLAAAHLIRSATAFDAYAFITGRTGAVKPGLYRLDPTMTDAAILAAITGGGANEATVTIPEGSNIFQIDAILGRALVIKPGALIALQGSGADGDLEGTLFPDTYNFYTDSSAAAVVKTMQANFIAKAAPVLAAAGEGPADAVPAPGSPAWRTLVIASILENEVRTQTDQELVAGILLKRLKAAMPLDIDATVAYANLMAEYASSTAPSGVSVAPSSSLLVPSSLDFKIKSPYNTYLYEGLPPGPIGNPGVSAITAALHPQSSPYWYYLSDPSTGETIFAKTLDEQTSNRVKYLVK